MGFEALAPEHFEALRSLNTCQISDGIETFGVRLRNEGFVRNGIRCLFPDLPPLLGYAVTAKIRTDEPPMTGKSFPDRVDWWNFLLSVPSPRIVVLQDVGKSPGVGSCAGEVHSHIFKSLACTGLVTNGAVRDLPAVKAMGFSLFATKVAVSRAYYHMLEFGRPVDIGELKIQPGDLLQGDQHGIISVPISIATEIPAAAARIAELERNVIDVAASPNSSLESLRDAVRRSFGRDRFQY